MCPTSRIECGIIHRMGIWSGMANQGRIIRLDESLISGKSMQEIEEIIKPMMAAHYQKAGGNYKKHELSSYVFYDLDGNATTYSLAALRL